MAFCGYCGSNVPDGMKFCTNCGKPLSAPSDQDLNNAPKVNPGFNTNSQNYNNQSYDAPVKHGLWDWIKKIFSTMHKIAKIIAGAIAVIFLILLISMVFTIVRGERANTNSNSGRQNPTVSSSSGNSVSSGSPSLSQSDNSGAVDPELKAFLDGYEDFMDEYVDFMKKYSDDPGNAMSMMGEYMEMLQKYEEFAAKAEKYDTDTMSPADAAYYLEVMTRIEKKMLEIY